jgi:anaerobic selenocysteine-containing dehydrogenase
MNHPVPELLAQCEVTPADARLLLEYYADPRPTATLIGAGLQRYRYGGENVRFINALAYLSGNIGVSGGGSYFHSHSYGNLNLKWIRPAERAPRRALPVATIGREILAAQHPPIRFIWVNGINVINQAPGIAETIKAFEQVDFKVVVDAFMTDTALRADLILPTTLMLEQEDIIGSYLHRYVQYARAVIPAPESARDDWWIIRNIAKRLAPPVSLPDADTCLEMALDTETLGCRLEDLRRRGCVAASVPRVAYANRVFDHQDGQYRFPDQLHPEPEGPDGYPLRLLSLIRRGAIHSQILEKDQKQPPTVWVAPDCPSLGRIDVRKPLKLVSPVGSITVELKPMTGLYRNAVLYRRGDWLKCGGGVNQVVAAETTDIGKGAAYYQQYVRLENE